MLGLGQSDAWWLVLGGFGAALGAWLFVRFRLGGGWLIRKARNGYLGWFKEAVDEHVAPQFEEMRVDRAEIKTELAAQQDIVTSAIADVRTELVAQQDLVRADLAERTAMEAESMTRIVHEQLVPLVGVVEGHVAADAEAFTNLDAANEYLTEQLDQIKHAIDNGGPP